MLLLSASKVHISMSELSTAWHALEIRNEMCAAVWPPRPRVASHFSSLRLSEGHPWRLQRPSAYRRSSLVGLRPVLRRTVSAARSASDDLAQEMRRRAQVERARRVEERVAQLTLCIME